MIFKVLFWLFFTIPFGLLSSQTNNSSLGTTESTRIVAWLRSVPVETENKSVGTNTENDSKYNPVSTCLDGIIQMQEETAALYKAHNQMLVKLAENQKVFYKKLESLIAANNELKQRISELEKQKK